MSAVGTDPNGDADRGSRVYPHLLRAVSIGSRRCRNRLVFPPFLTRYAHPTGRVTDRVVEHYRRLAAAGNGLVIVEASGVVSEARSLGGPGVWADEFVPGLTRLAAAIREGGALACLQLIDVLRYADRRPGDLDAREVTALVQAFVGAAVRAAAAGFDAVELHAAHSFTLADFLSRAANSRDDAYGVHAGGGTGILAEIIAGIRAAVPGPAIGVRFNGEDFVAGGNTLRQTRPIARHLEQAGCDYLHVSAGGRVEEGRSSYSRCRSEPPAYFHDAPNIYLARAVKQEVGLPVIGCGKIPTPQLAEQLLAAGDCDLVAVGRPQFRDPAWAAKAREGRGEDILPCLYCNNCTAGEWPEGRRCARRPS